MRLQQLINNKIVIKLIKQFKACNIIINRTTSMNIKAFTSACLLGAVLANKYQTFSRDHHLRE